MIRFVFRLFGLLLLALAFIFLVYDGMRSIADNVVRIASLQDQWNNINPASLAALHTVVQKWALWLDAPVLTPVLAAPIWLVLGIIGAVFIVLGRKKKPLIGYIRD